MLELCRSLPKLLGDCHHIVDPDLGGLSRLGSIANAEERGPIEVEYDSLVVAQIVGMDQWISCAQSCVLVPGGKEVRTFGTNDARAAADGRLAARKAGQPRGDGVDRHLTGGRSSTCSRTRHRTAGRERSACQALPGRKTDMKDVEWLADLLGHGLLRASFVRDRPQRELRELVRYRKLLVQEHSRMVTRIQKALEGANIKLTASPPTLSATSYPNDSVP